MNHSTAPVLSHILLAAGTGLLAGWALGDLTCRRRQGAGQLHAPAHPLPQPSIVAPAEERQMREIRGTLNDTHKMLRAVTKALVKPAS